MSAPEAPTPHEEPPEDLFAIHISRRALLSGFAGIAAGAVATPIALEVWRSVQRHDRSVSAAHDLAVSESPLERKAEVDENMAVYGMEKGWTDCNVWPGVAIISPEATLYSTPTTTKGTEISRPSGEQTNQLVVQRPFVIKPSLEKNRRLQGEPATGIGESVLGFWMPDSEQIAFIDQSDQNYEVVMATNSEKAIYSGPLSDDGFIGESVTLERAIFVDRLTWRYFDVSNPYELGEQPIHKVVGRSEWADADGAAYAYRAFETGQGDDVVQFPGTN